MRIADLEQLSLQWSCQCFQKLLGYICILLRLELSHLLSFGVRIRIKMTIKCKTYCFEVAVLALVFAPKTKAEAEYYNKTKRNLSTLKSCFFHLVII